MPGIYIHIPFCRQACNYCDFFFSTSLAGKDAVVDGIVKEIYLRKDYLSDKDLSSLYFGGGTPSLLSLHELEKVMAAVTGNFILMPSAEITLEANPDDINENVLKAWKNAGINRLSIGLQSFNDEELKWMNRAHNAGESVNSVKMAQDAGFGNITIDLIYGSRFQSLQSWERTLAKAISLKTTHISSYNLTIEKKTVLGHEFNKGKEPAVNDDLSSRQFLMMKDMLVDAGFIHYEISNFGLPGFLAKHNSNYWKGEHYLGLGPSAHSFNGDSRQWNVANNNLYSRALANNGPFFETEILSMKEKFNEYVLTRLRTMWGCDSEEIQHLFGNEYREHFLKEIVKAKQFIDVTGHVYILNSEGQLRADGIAAGLFA